MDQDFLSAIATIRRLQDGALEEANKQIELWQKRRSEILGLLRSLDTMVEQEMGKTKPLSLTDGLRKKKLSQ